MKDLNIVIVGAAGEGVQTVGEVFAETLVAHGYAVFAWQEFESRIRGGHNRYAVRVGEMPDNAPLSSADILLALNDSSAKKYASLIAEGGIRIADSAADQRSIGIPFREIAREKLGNPILANTVAAGALTAAIGVSLEVLNGVLSSKFSKKGGPVVEANLAAAAEGYRLAMEGCRGICPWQLPARDGRYLLISGNEALALAAARAGCRFMAAYPMSPSTEIITILAQNEAHLEVFTEQAEDEIAAINMAIGASFAGARAMTATSGGGFALMTEAVSLAGMIETPLVIVLAQRPGPATGLPTRTAQGDLLFAIHSGHGEFPKLVVAPADARDIFPRTLRAFDLADKYQIPVILMTDQFQLDSRYSIPKDEIALVPPTVYLAEPPSTGDYRRFALTENGVSPRLYPGQSHHLVTADSDEHDEHGHITEDLSQTAVAMVEKRLAKQTALTAEIQAPETLHLDTAETVLVGWGSSRQVILDAVRSMRAEGIAAGMIHFTELWPKPDFSFPEGKRYWSVESNATAQLASLLRSGYPVTFSGSVLRYDGLPLTERYIRRCIHA